VGIIKITNRNLFKLIIISIFLAMLVISYATYSKAKETKAFYTKTYIKAFEQVEITSNLIETILENKDNITSKETISHLSDIHNSLDMTAEDFKLISSRFLSNKPNTNYNFMPELIQLYSDEITRLQNELSKNNIQVDFDATKNVLFIRLALMKSDLQKIIAIDTPQFAKYTFDQTKRTWADLVNTLEYREVTKIYKLKHSTLFVKGYFFPFKK
jgi:hypothetical protein